MSPVGLFSELSLRGVTLSNRAVLSPMQTYRAVDGRPQAWHRAHLQQYAMGGFGLVFTEALAVEPRGRNTYSDAGIWDDSLIEDYAAVAAAIRAAGARAGAQLFHSGAKAARRRPWDGYGPLGADDAARGEASWPGVSPSAIEVDAQFPLPLELSLSEIGDLVARFGEAARRCDAAGFDVLEVHAAHGYLVHSFYSPLSNRRRDAYGGSLSNRMRFALDVAESVRANWSAEKPLSFRLSCVDGPEDGWSLEDTLVLAAELRRRGVDIIDCSSGGVGTRSTLFTSSTLTEGYQVHLAERVRRERGGPVMAVGLIRTPEYADRVIGTGQADLVAIGREALYDPYWVRHAAVKLNGSEAFDDWPTNYGFWLKKRAGNLKEPGAASR